MVRFRLSALLFPLLVLIFALFVYLSRGSPVVAGPLCIDAGGQCSSGSTCPSGYTSIGTMDCGGTKKCCVKNTPTPTDHPPGLECNVANGVCRTICASGTHNDSTNNDCGGTKKCCVDNTPTPITTKQPGLECNVANGVCRTICASGTHNDSTNNDCGGTKKCCVVNTPTKTPTPTNLPLCGSGGGCINGSSPEYDCGASVDCGTAAGCSNSTERKCSLKCKIISTGREQNCGYVCIQSSSCTNSNCDELIESVSNTCGGCSPGFPGEIGSISCCSACRKYLGYRECKDTSGLRYQAAECGVYTSNCGAGCGATATPRGGGGGGGGATDTPTPTSASSGDIRSRAVVVTNADTSCTAVRASTTGLDGTVHGFTASSANQPAPQTQTGLTFVQFNNQPAGSYTLAPVPPAGYLIKRACWSIDTTGATGEGLTRSLSGGQTLTWELGYTLGDAWVQALGGDVYSSGVLTSLTPSGASPREFNLDGVGGYPGVVTYGTDYDFAIETGGADPKGTGFVSSKDWLVNETYGTVNWYSTFYTRFGSPASADYDCSSGCSVTKPASRTTPYYAVGDMTTSGNWTIEAGETVIFIVNGNLTIDGTIRINGKGFAGFIVSGNITVSPGVGSPAANSNPDLEGMYVTSPTGTFATGTGANSGKARLVIGGSVIAGNFLLQRDLGANNQTTSAELFIYDPMLLVTMPDKMKEVKITWAEEAP